MTELGYSTIGGSSANTANYVGSKFTATESGRITEIKVYTKAASGSVDIGVAIYSDVAGQPTTLLAQDSGNTSVDTNAQWVSVPIEFTFEAGTTYWIFSWGSGSRTIYWAVGSTNQYYVNGGTFENWPTTESAGTFFARKISIYSEYLPIMQNVSKPTPSVTNATKVSIGETWDTWTIAWQSELRTWDELSKLIDNISKPTTTITNNSKP